MSGHTKFNVPQSGTVKCGWWTAHFSCLLSELDSRFFKARPMVFCSNWVLISSQLAAPHQKICMHDRHNFTINSPPGLYGPAPVWVGSQLWNQRQSESGVSLVIVYRKAVQLSERTLKIKEHMGFIRTPNNTSIWQVM